MLCEYEIILRAKPLCGYNDFVPYKSVFDALKQAVIGTNHLPKQLIEAFIRHWPIFCPPAINRSSSGYQACAATKFFIHSAAVFDRLKGIAGDSQIQTNDVVLEDSDLRDILSEMVGGFSLDENTFLTNILSKLKNCKKSVVLK
jgi:hypothetical protein